MSSRQTQPGQERRPSKRARISPLDRLREPRRRGPRLSATATTSLLVHALALLLLGPVFQDCAGGDALPPGPDSLGGDASAESMKQPEELAVIDLAVEEARDEPEVPDRVKAPEEQPKEPDKPKPEPPEVEKPKPKPKPKVLKKEDGSLMIDQPKVAEESEPPPDTKVLAPQNRRVLQETQPTRRALKATLEQPELPKKPEQVEEPEDEPTPPKKPEQTPLAKAEPKGEPEKKAEPPPKPAAQTPSDAKEESAAEPSKAQKRRRAGEPGQGAASNDALPGAPVPSDPTGDKGAAGSPRAGEEAEAGDNQAGASGSGDQFDVAAAMRVDPGRYQEIFGERDAADQKRLDGRQRRILGRWQERVKATRAALENFVPNVRFGNQIAINARRSEYAGYIAAIHRKIHRLWGIGYLRHLDTRFGGGHPLSNPSLRSIIELVIDARSGQVEEANIVETSGVLEYDAEAIRVVLAVSAGGPAPSAIVSPDNKVYLHWKFHRDTRQCGTFGVSVYVLDKKGNLDQYNVEEQLDDLNEAHPAGTRAHRHSHHGHRVDPSLITGDAESPDGDKPAGASQKEGAKPASP